MDLHPGERIVFEGRPSWRSIIGFYAVGIVAAAVVAAIVGAVASTGAGIGAFLVIVAGVVGVGFLKRLDTNYTITNERLYIRHGLLSKKVQQTKLERVQNVNTEQSFLQRLLQIGTVDFDTAGTDDSDFTFAGVANPDEVVAAVDRAQREGTGPAA